MGNWQVVLIAYIGRHAIWCVLRVGSKQLRLTDFFDTFAVVAFFQLAFHHSTAIVLYRYGYIFSMAQRTAQYLPRTPYDLTG